MTFRLYIDHPGAPTFTREYPNYGQAREAYIVTGLIPGGSKCLMGERDEIVLNTAWEGIAYADGQIDACKFMTNSVRALSWGGKMGPEHLDILKQGMKSSISNAQQVDTDYSRGVADAVGLIFRTVDTQESLSESRVDSLIKDMRSMIQLAKADATGVRI